MQCSGPAIDLSEESVMAEKPEWDLKHVRSHLRMAAFLEAWTIPYYMAAMFSIVDRVAPAYQLIQSVLHQEMLHLQLVANIANAYGPSPHFEPRCFSYEAGPDEKIPYLHFKFGPHTAALAASGFTPQEEYTPRSATIGPLDEARINTMCLIEYPNWMTGSQPAPCSNLIEYDSIGQFYDALEYGVTQLKSAHIVGGRRQVDMFSAFYRRLPRLTVDSGGDEGLKQVLMLLGVIRDQGEAATAADDIHWPNENTADDPAPKASHYDKFCQIRENPPLPTTYADTVGLTKTADYTADQLRYERILIGNFSKFIAALNGLFAGKNPGHFAPLMVTIGANILTCWQHGVTPKFTGAGPAARKLSATTLPEEDFYAL
jgi:ferritin-like protein